MLNPKCDTCMSSRPIISENGIHHSCILSDAKALRCMVNGEYYIPVVSANNLAKSEAFKEAMFLGCHLRLFAWDKTAYCSVPNARQGRYAKYWMPLPEPPKEDA